ncbi:2,5-diamino-6-ribosylamino-4-pyrimidinone 5'-phosphate reductase [Golovinomyces cichoracearum]|uniref:2,5-diamino-6-ribosylamino-4(3H)-pyrimidinone 5'-phosphate reductase n=1 Tax=Golovinomyces cichoracearum TaxID=62708 RepID=A0A420HLU1_9PEZI|nr:2,5-diamino-6-ribosylamino-4-pyrimidinone 5'-phosphate reductase [Golovinomyces cichoracearum]
MANSENSLRLNNRHINALLKYLPIDREEDKSIDSKFPTITLTYAASLDSNISVAPRTTTKLSGSESKAMTHYLRAHHDAILVGATTAITDNPHLISRWVEVHNNVTRQPRPIIVDPSGRWLAGLVGTENLFRLVREERGKAPWVFVDSATVLEPGALVVLGSCGCECLYINNLKTEYGGICWIPVLVELAKRGISSLMVEGGATVLNDLLRKQNQHLLSTVIITIAPVYLGAGGVAVSPEKIANKKEVLRLQDVSWIQMGEDVVMAGFP